jgi:transcriptional regulator with XRE-family HTH domain
MTEDEKIRYQKQIGRWLTSIREEKGLSQEALGIQLGKGQSDVAKIETGSKKVTFIDIIFWMVSLNIPYERLEEELRPIHKELINKGSA